MFLKPLQRTADLNTSVKQCSYVTLQESEASLKNLHVWLKGLRRVGEEEDMEEGESIDPHGRGGGLVCQREDNAWKEEDGVKDRKR